MRLFTTLLVAALMMLGSITAVQGQIPSPLPSGSVLFNSTRCALPATTCKQARNNEIYLLKTDGTVLQLTSDSQYDSWWPKLSPDRTKVMFHRTDAGLKERDGFQRTSLWIVPVSGGTPTKLISASKGIGKFAGGADASNFGFVFLGHAEWSANASYITFAGAKTATPQLQGYAAAISLGSTPAVSTPYRMTFGAGSAIHPGIVLDPAFQPAGNIIFIGCIKDSVNPNTCKAGASPQDLLIAPNSPSSGGGELPLTETADGTVNFDPYYNTDSGQIGWLNQQKCNRFGIRHKATNTATTAVFDVINDGKVNSKPSWLNSNTLYFHRWVDPITSTVWQVNATTGSGGLIDTGSGFDLSILCQTDSVVSTSTPAGGTVDPTGLSTNDYVLASNRCATTCVVPSNWKIYRRQTSSTTTVLAGGSDANGRDSYAPRISPSRKQILFFRADGGSKGNPYTQELWVMYADGTSPKMLIKSGDAGNPFSLARFGEATWGPAGDRIVLAGATVAQGKNDQIYRLTYDPVARTVSTLTKISFGSGTVDRPGAQGQPAYSPDGTRVAFVGCGLIAARTSCDAARSGAEIVTTSSTGTSSINAAEATPTVTSDGSAYRSPIYSPNGSTIAAVNTVTCSSTKIIKVAPSGGTITSFLTGAIHFDPQWSFDGSSLLFTALPNNVRATIWKVDANAPNSTYNATTNGNGTNLIEVTGSTPCASEYPFATP